MKYILFTLIAVLLVGCVFSPKVTPAAISTSNVPEQSATEAPALLINTPTPLFALKTTSTTRLSSTSTSTPEPSVKFSLNYAGELEQDGIKVEVARVLFAQRDAIAGPGAFDNNSNLDGQEYIGEIIWRITNNTQKGISWSWSDIAVRVNGRQIKLESYLSGGYFGETPTDEIFPGSTIIGGVYFGIGSTQPNDITSFDLLMGSPHDSEYNDLSSNFIITVDLTGEHKWNPLPDELK
jgi:hypothetical protein